LLLPELSERHVDFLVARRLGALANEQLDFEDLFDDKDVIVAGGQNPWLRRRKIELSELMNEVWVLPPPDNVVGSVATKAFRARGFDYPRTTVFSDSPHVRMTLVETGRYLSIFPASSLRFRTGHPQIKDLPIELPGANVPVGIFTLKNRTPAPIARLFIEHAREVARPLGGGK
jgi:DNA-binding transcriptional LysR family regulator